MFIHIVTYGSYLTLPSGIILFATVSDRRSAGNDTRWHDEPGCVVACESLFDRTLTGAGHRTEVLGIGACGMEPLERILQVEQVKVYLHTTSKVY